MKSTLKKEDAARESTPRTAIEDSRAHAHGSENPEARAIQRAIYGYHPGPFTWRTRRAVPKKHQKSIERFLVKGRRTSQFSRTRIHPILEGQDRSHSRRGERRCGPAGCGPVGRHAGRRSPPPRHTPHRMESKSRRNPTSPSTRPLQLRASLLRLPQARSHRTPRRQRPRTRRPHACKRNRSDRICSGSYVRQAITMMPTLHEPRVTWARRGTDGTHGSSLDCSVGSPNSHGIGLGRTYRRTNLRRLPVFGRRPGPFSQ